MQALQVEMDGERASSRHRGFKWYDALRRKFSAVGNGGSGGSEDVSAGDTIKSNAQLLQ